MVSFGSAFVTVLIGSVRQAGRGLAEPLLPAPLAGRRAAGCRTLRRRAAARRAASATCCRSPRDSGGRATARGRQRPLAGRVRLVRRRGGRRRRRCGLGGGGGAGGGAAMVRGCLFSLQVIGTAGAISGRKFSCAALPSRATSVVVLPGIETTSWSLPCTWTVEAGDAAAVDAVLDDLPGLLERVLGDRLAGRRLGGEDDLDAADEVDAKLRGVADGPAEHDTRRAGRRAEQGEEVARDAQRSGRWCHGKVSPRNCGRSGGSGARRVSGHGERALSGAGPPFSMTDVPRDVRCGRPPVCPATLRRHRRARFASGVACPGRARRPGRLVQLDRTGSSAVGVGIRLAPGAAVDPGPPAYRSGSDGIAQRGQCPSHLDTGGDGQRHRPRRVARDNRAVQPGRRHHLAPDTDPAGAHGGWASWRFGPAG